LQIILAWAILLSSSTTRITKIQQFKIDTQKRRQGDNSSSNYEATWLLR
jgi:hypothetical protein